MTDAFFAVGSAFKNNEIRLNPGGGPVGFCCHTRDTSSFGKWRRSESAERKRIGPRLAICIHQPVVFLRFLSPECLRHTMNLAIFNKLLSLFRPRMSSASLFGAFEKNQNSLKPQFFEKAAAVGIPRGLRWVRCDWLPDKVLLRDRATGQISLLVSVNLSFEAIEGGDMEDVKAVGLVRDACAVFQLTPNGWEASGRALFNMNPTEAVRKLESSYQPYPS